MQPSATRSPTPSHQLVTNRDVAPDDAWVRAENATLGACLDAGLDVELALDLALLRVHAPAVADALGGLASVDEPVFQTGCPVVRATPDDRTRMLNALGIGRGERPSLWRVRGIDRIAAVDGDAWRYYSVPNKEAVRVLDDPSPDLKAAIRSTIADVPCTGLFPYGTLATWTVADIRVELTAEELWLVRADGETQWYPHDTLQGVVVDPAACELVLTWPTRRDGASSSLGRVVGRLLDRRKESPPRFLHPPDDAVLEAAATAYELVADRLCQDFEVRRQAGVAARVRG
ncbi:hypothetical protein NDI85_05345 [Halomicroarcula sp. S1AR25-4]|uniref:hypothetical protein n=1 Tax=Haloarcula sp. S1AR25-4 TaxID=2950538 RepID=UPI0028750765|nr:hypothetical protein [Halomicroarcula sp. S1AR25-4]MDS0277208.1 hypothetical protein [Halomicroarcula sp. S1AR25-4]